MILRNVISKLFTCKKQEPETASKEQINTTPSEQPTAPEKETDSPVTDYIQLGCPTLKEAFEQKYPKSLGILKMFEAANLCDATWENLTKVRLQRFVGYMGERLSPNSVNQYATKLKAVLNLYSDEVMLPRGFAKVLTPRKVTVQNVYLTESEIARIIAYVPKNDREALVQAQFVIGVLSLARHGDYCNFDASNIIDGNLVYVSQKTKIAASVPASPTLLRFLKRQRRIIDKGVTVSDDSFNATIRRICAKCGIDEPVKLYHRGETTVKPKWAYVSSHTARRTGVTNLYLRGLDIVTIARLAGHTSTETTMGYICCGIRELPQEAKDYFGGFGA